MVGGCSVWHDICTLRQHTRSNNVENGMPSWPLGSIHMVKLRRVWHSIFALAHHTCTTWEDVVRRGMPSSPLGSTGGQTKSGMTCHLLTWTAHTVGRCRAWHAIIALGQHTRLNYVRRGTPSSPLDSIHAMGQHRALHPTSPFDNIEAHMIERHRRVMTSSTLDYTHEPSTSGVAYHHFPFAAHMHTQLDVDERVMPLSPLDRTHNRDRLRQACHSIIPLGRTQGQHRAWHAIIALVWHTHGRRTSGVACNHHCWTSYKGVAFPHGPWVAHAVEQRQAWHAIIAIGKQTQQHKWSDDIRCDMPSSHLDITHDGKMSGVACHYRPCPADTFVRRLAWHTIIALRKHTQSQTTSNMTSIFTLGQHTLSDDVRGGMLSFPLDCTHENMVRRRRRGMPSSNFDCTHTRMTSGVACYHIACTAHTVKRYGALDAIIVVGQHTRSDDVKRGIFGQHTWFDDFERGMPSSPLDNTHDRTTSGVTWHHRPWKAHTVGQHGAWHPIIALGKNLRSDYVRLGMLSSLLNNTCDLTT
ncbi:hypothetical protein EJD97_008475 [Solanum chilense]|uniref:Uncharacterized protein n=1 Tax=Solanum chilense TaxID=4083 RepID=A0A6N2AJN5_SOLCI|nr:hypothetical protein EJD97_008475 [Solanum chilense]